MTPTAEQVAAIAKGLTLGERIYVLRLEEVQDGGEWGVFKPTRKAIGLLRKAGVVSPDHQGGDVLTSLGLAVRAHIIGETK